MQRFFTKEFILPNLLVLSMVSHWLLPEGIEQKLYLHVFDLVFYLPDICYFIYMVFYSEFYGDIKPFEISKNKKGLIVFGVLFSCLMLLTNYGISALGDTINILINNFTIFYAFYLFFYYPLPPSELDKTKYLLTFALVVISLEIILFSMGILSYTSEVTGTDLTDGGFETGGIFRISTTIGAATGSAMVVLLLGIVCTSCFIYSKYIQLTLLFLTTIAIFFSISRGSIIVWSFYLVVYLYKNYLSGGFNERKLIAIIIICTFAVYAFQHGILDPLIERQSRLNDNNNILANRDEKFDMALQIIKESNYLGIGSGMIRPDKALIGSINKMYSFSPHNTYLLLLGELGIVGILCLLGIYWSIIKNLDYSKIYAMTIPVMLLVTFNTEIFILEQQCFPMFALLLLYSYKYNQEESYQFL